MRLYTILLAAVVVAHLIACSDSRPKDNFTRRILDLSREAELTLTGNNPDMHESFALLDTLYNRLAKNMNALKDPQEKIALLNDFLYNEWGLVPESDTSTIENVSLSRILKSKRGSCLGIVCLYLALADKLELPLRGAVLPGHIFVRFRDDKIVINIETLKQGIQRTNAFYRRRFSVPKDSLYYMQDLTLQKVEALFLYNLGNEYRKKKYYRKAEEKYKASLTLFPDFAEAHINLGHLYLLTGEKDKALKERELARRKNPYLETIRAELARRSTSVIDPHK